VSKLVYGKWLSFDDAVEMICSRTNAGIGQSQTMLRTACASGEILSGHSHQGYGMIISPLRWKGYETIDEYGRELIDGVPPLPVEILEDDLRHWLDQRYPVQPPEHAKQGKRTRNKRDRAAEAVNALWPDGVPDQTKLPHPELCKQVNDWLKADCEQQHFRFIPVSDDTILRAALRK
jgi:hypothetical protein